MAKSAEGRGAAFAIIILLALLVRILVSVAAYASTFDTATVGLMAIRILNGERPLFFEGQTYMGSLEAYLAALMFKLFGIGEFTLSLSPVLFSLGWVGATFLFFEELFGTLSGIGAGLTLVLPTWVTLWYCIGSYGGYPSSFFFGTVAMWLAIRITKRDLSGLKLWVHAFFMGLASGLAIWSDFLAAVYVLTGALLILAWLTKRRFSLTSIVPFFGAALAGLVGAAPVFLNWRKILMENTQGLTLSRYIILDHLRGLLSRPLRDNLAWHGKQHTILLWTMLLVLCAGAVLFVWDFCTTSSARRRQFLFPILFCALFLVFYVLHPMASRTAPRHILPLWTMAIASVFASPLSSEKRIARVGAWVLLAAWLVGAGTQDVIATAERRPQKLETIMTRRGVAEAAQRLELKNIEMIGGRIFGLQGQVFGFATAGRVNFVSVFDERHQPSAQAADGDASAGFACRKKILPLLTKALDDLGVEYKIEEAADIRLVHSMEVPHIIRRAIPARYVSADLMGSAEGSAAGLTDRKEGTVVTGPFGEGEGFVIKIAGSRLVNGLYLLANQMSERGLPENVRVEAATSGSEWQCVRPEACRVPSACISGNRVYMEGYNPVMEIRFAPVQTTRLRLTFFGDEKEQEKWSIDEICVFEHIEGGNGPVMEDEVYAVAKEFLSQKCVFAVCDRWLSAKLFSLLGMRNGRPVVFPRFNPRHRDTLLPRHFAPEPGTAFVLPLELVNDAEECLKDAYGESLRWERKDFDHYVFLLLTSAESSVTNRLLKWDGVMLRRAGGS